MQRRSWLVFGFVVAGAATCFLALFVKSASTIGPRGAWGLSAFVGLGILSEALALDFRIGSTKAAKSSISYIPLFAAGITFGAFWTVLAGAIIVGVSDMAIRRRRAWVCLFNTSQYILALSAATAAYAALGGGPFALRPLNVPAFFAMGTAYFSVNLGVVSIFLSVRNRQPLFAILGQATGPAGGNLWYDLLASPFAVLAAWLYNNLYIGGLTIAVLPLLLVRYTYLSTVQLRQINSDLLTVLVKAIETRDPYTSGHSVRVATLARIVAEDMGLPDRTVRRVERAALLHDIGKIEARYAAIISKPFDLSPAERALIKTHATKGADLLLSLSAFSEDEVIKGVRHHHERFDGTGYPDGLKGAEIPVAARIIMISDSVDAMLSDRPYRTALSDERVERELLTCSGTQFDPDIVSVVLSHDTLERARVQVPADASPLALASN